MKTGEKAERNQSDPSLGYRAYAGPETIRVLQSATCNLY